MGSKLSGQISSVLMGQQSVVSIIQALTIYNHYQKAVCIAGTMFGWLIENAIAIRAIKLCIRQVMPWNILELKRSKTY